MSSSWQPDPLNLTHTRINRLLRPLRLKCLALASYSVPATTTTYAKSCPTPHLPPLAVLPPPATNPLKASSSNLDLSRRIYAVRDAYKHLILSATLNPTSSHSPSPSPVPSLTSLCSTIVGQNMPSELQKPVDYLDAPSDPSAELYDDVPLQYRGWTLLSHALSIILELCPLSPTLLIILLDLLVFHKLPLHAQHILRVLLIYSISPPKSFASPPICHPSHATFLQDLLDQWLSAGFSESAFLYTLSDVWLGASNVDVWQSKALSKLVKSVHRIYTSWVLHLLSSLTHSLALYAKSAAFDPSTLDDLAAILSTWLRRCCDYYVSCSPAKFDAIIQHDIYQLLLQGDLLVSRQRWGISSTNLQNISSSFIGIATSWLFFSSHHLPKSQGMVVASMLQKVKPCPSTYTDLVRCVYKDRTTDECWSIFQSFASSLVSHGLLQLEASLSACANEQECETLLTTNNSPDQVKEFIQKLAGWADEAEKRCFGKVFSTFNGPSRHSLPNLGAPHGWKFEASVDCFIPASPARPYTSASACHRVKRRRYHEPPRRSLQDLSTNCLRPDEAPFKSLLANAVSNRVSLHSSDLVVCVESDGDEDECAPEVHEPSDDLLDLFAYNTSSPVK